MKQQNLCVVLGMSDVHNTDLKKQKTKNPLTSAFK